MIGMVLEFRESVCRMVSWHFCPLGFQYRNGLNESRVEALKKTLAHMFTAGVDSLHIFQFNSLLTRCTNIINDCPEAEYLEPFSLIQTQLSVKKSL